MSLVEVRFRRYHRAERLTRSGLLFSLPSWASARSPSTRATTYCILSSAHFFLPSSSRDCCRSPTFVISRSRSTRWTRSMQVVRRRWPSGFAIPVRFRCSLPRCASRDGSKTRTQRPFVAARSTRELPLTLTLPTRGRVMGLRAGIASAFPFGIVEMSRDVAVGGELIVYPRDPLCSSPAAGGARRAPPGEGQGRRRRRLLLAVSVPRGRRRTAHRLEGVCPKRRTVCHRTGGEVSAGDTVLPGHCARRMV